MNYLLGVDLGTSGTKTVLFDEDGNVVASKTIEYPLYQEKNGWAGQSRSRSIGGMRRRIPFTP